MATIEVKYGIMPGKIASYQVEAGTKLESFLNDQKAPSGYKITLSGKTVHNTDIPLKSNDTIILTEKISGNADKSVIQWLIIAVIVICAIIFIKPLWALVKVLFLIAVIGGIGWYIYRQCKK